MAIKGLQSKQLANNPSTPAPKFNFRKYSTDATFVNNSENIDFVTYDGSLYVCTSSTPIQPTHTDPIENGGFLLVVAKGEDGKQGKQGKDGADGKIPQIGARFNGGQLEIFDSTGTRLTTSPDLTGKVWKPVQEGSTLSWELSKSNSVPSDIDLEQLRPVEERPLLLRVDSDNTKRSDEESGPANMIQWKHEGDANWTNLISIAELMNLALAGVSIWSDEDTNKWHFGHREVIKAQYESNRDGQKIISHVELGNILFDAGELPFANYELDFEDFESRLSVLENATHDSGFDPTILNSYLTKLEANGLYQPKGSYVTSVNGVSPQPGSNGAITIDVGNLGSFDIRLKNDGKTLEKTLNGTTWTDIVDLSQFGGSGSGCDKCWSQEEIVQLIENVLSGRIPTNIVVPSDLDAYVKWTDISGTYATMSWVSDEIARALSGGQYEPEYHRVFTLYQRTNDRLTPPNPPLANVWEWNLTEGDILTDESHKSGWDNHPQNATTALPYLWMASATFSSVTHKEVKPSNASSAWTLVCLTGEAGLAGANGFNGTDGADGNGVEFIFTLIRDINDKNSIDTPVAPSSSQADSYPAGWEDHPQGIGYYIPNQITTTLENLGNNEILFGIELASMRTYTNGQWGPYCAPFIWSMWGEDGIDGDGVEYIFIVADENSTDINTTTGKITLQEQLWKVEGSSPNFIPTTEEQVRHLGLSYQVPDWVGTRNNGWTDNPSDVDTQQPFEFVAIRKYHDGTGWGPFCEPKLWSHFGGITVNPVTTITTSAETNYVPYKEWAFYRANDADGTTHTDLSTYDVVYDFSSFGTQSNPDPVYSDLTPEQKLQFYRNPELYTKTVKNGQVLNITWQDTVPSGDGQLWVITAHIADESQSTDRGWTTPSMWGDKAGFNVEYSASEEANAVYTNPSLLNNHNLTFNDYQGSEEQRESDWRTAVKDAGYGVWNDVVENPKYMATTVLGENGIWSKWTITKIVGEDGARGPQGEPGQDGNGVEFVFFALTPEQYNNRSNFIGNDNKFYVYDNLEHDQKTWNNNEYLPYAIISDVPEGRLWATDDNPGITEERPYVFVSARHQVNGVWNQFHNIPGTGLMTSFGPASLWLAGDEIDYEASTINVSDDTIQIDIDPETKYPTLKTFSSDTHSIQFYHGLKALSVDEIRVLVNDSWELLGKVVAKSNESGYEYVPSEVTTSFGQLTSKLSVDEYGKPRAFWLSVTPTAETVFIEQNVKLKFYSIDGFVNELGVYSHYVAELNIDLIPVELSNYWVLTHQQEEIITKSSADALTYNSSFAHWTVALNNDSIVGPNTRLEGIQSIPGIYSKWTLDIDFDNTTYYTGSLIGSIYRNWVQNVKTDNENSDDSQYYKLDGTVCTNRQYPITINCYKTFYGDGHYFHDFVIVQISPDKYSLPLTDKIVGKLYYDGNLIDEQTIPIVYNGKDGSSLKVNEQVVTEATVTNDELTFQNEEEEVAGLTVDRFDSELLTNVSSMTFVDSETNKYVGLKDIQSISLSNNGDMKYIKIVNNSGNLNISLNYAALVADLRQTLFGGNEPVVQTIVINDGTDTQTAQFNNNGGFLLNQPLTVHADGITSVVSDADDTFTVDPSTNTATIDSVTSGFTVNTSTGSSYIKVSGNTNNAPAAPSVMAACNLIIGSEDDVPGRLTIFIRCPMFSDEISYKLYLSKPLKVMYLSGNNVEEFSNYYNTHDYDYLFNSKNSVIEIPRTINSEDLSPEIVLSFEDVIENTLISAYAIVTATENDTSTDYRSATVYFRSTKSLPILIEP